MPVLGLQPQSEEGNQVAMLPAGHKHPALPSRKSLSATMAPSSRAASVMMGLVGRRCSCPRPRSALGPPPPFPPCPTFLRLLGPWGNRCLAPQEGLDVPPTPRKQLSAITGVRRGLLDTGEPSCATFLWKRD